MVKTFWIRGGLPFHTHSSCSLHPPLSSQVLMSCVYRKQNKKFRVRLLVSFQCSEARSENFQRKFLFPALWNKLLEGSVSFLEHGVWLTSHWVPAFSHQPFASYCSATFSTSCLICYPSFVLFSSALFFMFFPCLCFELFFGGEVFCFPPQVVPFLILLCFPIFFHLLNERFSPAHVFYWWLPKSPVEKNRTSGWKLHPRNAAESLDVFTSQWAPTAQGSPEGMHNPVISVHFTLNTVIL